MGVNGTISVSMLNLTDGETAYTPVPGLQNVALGSSWSTWRTNMIANPARAGVIVYVDVGALTNSEFDNFVIVPEPASAALIGLGGLLMLRRRGR